jgi:cell division protein FtsZ
MSINLGMPELTELRPKITVLGVGGAGGNAVNNMIRGELQGVDFVALNTDAQALMHSQASQKLQLGVSITQGLGAGAQPEVGRASAEEAIDAIDESLAGCHMAFITAGMGGGTGTGAAPVVARLAKEKGILTVGVVTKPFQFEGAKRSRIADAGIEELQSYVDTLIIIPNQNLFRVANEKTTFQEAFRLADDVLYSGVRGITDLMVMPGLINLDFADVRKVMWAMGKAMMGTGEAEGENRAINAAEAAISNPLLDEASMKGAEGVIINITGGTDLTLYEVDEAANHIRNQVDPEAEIIIGSAFNEDLDGRVRVAVVATGIGDRPAGAARLEGSRIVDLRPAQTGVDDLREPPAVTNGQSADADDEQLDIEAAVEESESDIPFIADSESSLEVCKADFDDEEPHVDDAFLPSESAEIEEARGLLGTADPFAEAAIENGAVEAAVVDVVSSPGTKPGPEAPRLTLFEKVLSFKETKASKEAQQPDLSVEHFAEDEPLFETSSDIGPLTADDRSVPPLIDDQLEIPAFLKRTTH